MGRLLAILVLFSACNPVHQNAFKFGEQVEVRTDGSQEVAIVRIGKAVHLFINHGFRTTHVADNDSDGVVDEFRNVCAVKEGRAFDTAQTLFDKMVPSNNAHAKEERK